MSALTFASPAMALPRRAVRVAPREMLAVACPTAAQCTGVGDSGLAVTFDPRSPRHRRTGTIDALHSLFGIACVTSRQCTVSANPGRELTFDPQTLKVMTSRLLLPHTDDSTVACATRHLCVQIAGSREVTFDPLAPSHRKSAHLPTGVSRVACPSQTECVAVDPFGAELTFDPRSPGAAGQPVRLDSSGLASVSCPSMGQCTAIGDTSGNAITFDPRSPASFNSAPVDPNDSELLDDVSCPSLRQCTAVDGNVNGVTFNPRSPGRPTPVRLLVSSGVIAITCPSNAQCTVIADQRELTFDPRHG